MPEVLIDIKDTQGDRPQKPSRFSTSYLGLYLHFLRVLNINPQGTSDRYPLRMSVEVHMYPYTIHVSASSMIEVCTRRCYNTTLSLDWLAYVFLQQFLLDPLSQHHLFHPD